MTIKIFRKNERKKGLNIMGMIAAQIQLVNYNKYIAS